MKEIFNYLDNFYIQEQQVEFDEKHYEYFNKPDSDISDKIGYCKLEKTGDEYTTSANVFLPTELEEALNVNKWFNSRNKKSWEWCWQGDDKQVGFLKQIAGFNETYLGAFRVYVLVRDTGTAKQMPHHTIWKWVKEKIKIAVGNGASESEIEKLNVKMESVKLGTLQDLS